MKYPHDINSNFFKVFLYAGWYQNREVICDLPSHIKELPEIIQKFLKQIWYLSIVNDYFHSTNLNKIEFFRQIYIFGETTEKLEDFSDTEDEDAEELHKLVNCKIRNFGYKDGRSLLIDEKGRIYILADTGSLYFSGAKFYEGIYNLIANKNIYLVGENKQLLIEEEDIYISANLSIDDFE